jgi:flagellar biosynthesis anti-sigma factor FlgM
MEGRATDRQKQPVDSVDTEQTEPSYWDRLIQQVKRAVKEAPEVREDRVAAMKRALQNGTLNLHGTELADKLLDATRNDSAGEA